MHAIQADQAGQSDLALHRTTFDLKSKDSLIG